MSYDISFSTPMETTLKCEFRWYLKKEEEKTNKKEKEIFERFLLWDILTCSNRDDVRHSFNAVVEFAQVYVEGS